MAAPKFTSSSARALLRYRGRTPSGALFWTEQEDQIVKEFYPDRAAMEKQLPRRSREAIRFRVKKLKLGRPRLPWTAREVSMLRRRWPEASKSELIAEFPRHPWRGIDAKGRSMGLKRRKKLRTVGAKLVDEIRGRAVDLNISLKHLDEICVGRRYFTDPRRSPNPRRNILLRAIAALGGRVEIVWR